MKDAITVWESNGSKVRKQKRYLMFKLREAFNLFREEGSDQIGFSKFCSLRPQEVVLSRNTPQDVCLCCIHENFFQLVFALSKRTNLPEYHRNWVAENTRCTNCSDQCEVCSNGKLLDKYFTGSDKDDTVDFFRWERSAENGFFRRVRIEMSLEEAIKSLKVILPGFIIHHTIKRHQHSAYEADKLSATAQDIVIQVDFSENYACLDQREIQSAYWGQKQLTLFCACVWTGQDRPQNIIVVSDSTKHDKSTALKYLCIVMDHVMKTPLKHLTIWSDGPSSQFKNRYIAKSLDSLSEHYNIEKLEWAYFATAHGKGPVDGIGGASKRHVRNAVLRQAGQVNNARTFVQVAEKEVPNVKFLLGDESEAPPFIADLTMAAAVVNISKCHYLCFENGALSKRDQC